MIQLFKTLPLLIAFTFLPINLLHSQSPLELPLWPDGFKNNPVKYTSEKVRVEKGNKNSPSQNNRVFSQVSEPTYTLFQPKKGKANGVAIVICPGGGFRDVWFDREGVDFAMWLAEKGITSLVLKYRTYNSKAEGLTLTRDEYNGEVYADAKQAIHILRNQANELDIDKNKIGICGYSAGGALALYAALEMFEDKLPGYTHFNQQTRPDFACLVYPGIRDATYDAIEQNDDIPPMFMINGAEDDVTPAHKCIKLYSTLMEKSVPAELHIYSIGRHGFDSGVGRGYSVASWQDSFLLWLKDMKFLS